MRTTIPALALLLGCTAILPAQAPTAKDIEDQKQLDFHLKEWEAKMRTVTALHATITRINKDAVFKSATKFHGMAMYMKIGKPGAAPLNLAYMELKIEGKKEIAEKIISTGTYLYQWVPQRKEIHQHEIPRPKAGVPMEDNFLGLVFGMKAEQAKKRYGLKLYKVDKYYVYVDITPKFREDKAEFEAARLVLHRSSYLPRQLWFKHPNKTEVLWDIPTAKVPAALDRRWFDAPRPEAGWKIVPVPRAAPGATPPRVIRGERP
jgi:TIGR03009 family protein